MSRNVFTLHFLAALLALSSCTPSLTGRGKGGKKGEEATFHPEELRKELYQKPLKAQRQYGAPLAEFIHTPREQEYFNRANRAIMAAGFTGLPHDPKLTLVARDIARYYKEQGALAPLWFVQFSLQRAGSIDMGPFYRVLVIKGQGDGALNKELITLAREILGEGKTALGVSIIGPPGSTRYMAMVAVERAVEIEPVAKEHRRGDTLKLTGRSLLDEGEGDLFLHVAYPKGETRTIGITPEKEGTFTVSCPLPEVPGRYRVEISQQRGLWSKPLGLLFVYVETKPPTTFRVPYTTTSQDIKTVEGWVNRLVELINWDRQYFGVKPLKLDQSLTALAQDDARIYAAKKDPLGQGKALAQRLQRHHILAIEAHAVVGSARSVEELHSSFMNTPSFRARIISPRITHVGVGVEQFGEGQEQGYHVLEYFARLAMEIDPLQWSEDALEMLNSGRREGGHPPLKVDPRLQEIAREFALEIFNQQAVTPDLLPRIQQAILSEGLQGESAYDIKVVSQLGELHFAPSLLEGTFTHVGLGVSQGSLKGKRKGSRLVGVVTIATTIPWKTPNKEQ